MKVVKNNDDNQPLTLAELAAIQQFEQSHRDGQAVFRPVVAAGLPVPNCVVFLEETGRFAVTILEGRYAVQGDDWVRLEANGIQVPVGNPLEAAWQAGKSVRTYLNRKLELNTYVMAVVWFPDMGEDQDIMDEVDGRSVGLFFEEVDLVQLLAGLPREDQLQPQLSSRYIQKEVAALSRAAEPEPAGEPEPVNGRAGAMNIGRVEIMNVYITIANGGGDDDPPLITVRGQ